MRVDPRLVEAKQWVIEHFPFPGYVEAGIEPYTTVGELALRHLDTGDRVFDFGSGPCDKTAILWRLGFVCFTYDDLQDPWHLWPGAASA